MFQVSEKASEKIKEFLNEKSLDDAIRILMFGVGDPGPLWAWLWMSQKKMMRFLSKMGLHF
jgi:hypothetical protein